MDAFSDFSIATHSFLVGQMVKKRKELDEKLESQ